MKRKAALSVHVDIESLARRVKQLERQVAPGGLVDRMECIWRNAFRPRKGDTARLAAALKTLSQAGTRESKARRAKR